MSQTFDIAFFGSSLVSAYWNGAATYYRGLLRALHERGHRVTFYEPDAFDRQQHRDLPDPDFARSVVYPAEEEGVHEALRDARSADLIVKASGVGIFDELLETAVLDLKDEQTLVVYWDVDAPATLDRLRSGESTDRLQDLISAYDLIFTYGGGPPVVDAYESIGAKRCVPIYNALDPDTHHPVEPDDHFDGLLGFLGNRMPDRETRIEEFFFTPARAFSDRRFLLGGSGWEDKVEAYSNVSYLGHVYTRDHNAFNCTPKAVLNVNRESMARYGFSPPTRIFEAAGAGACLITDAWRGIDRFLEPGEECLVARSGDDVIEYLQSLSVEEAAAIGEAARKRLLAEHTYAHRAETVESVLMETRAARTEVLS